MPDKRKIPLFPLGIVLYPDEQIPLHIFESRYKQMIATCLEEGKPFGIVFFSEGVLADVGCLARINRVERVYEDGRLDIQVNGIDRFRILEVDQGSVYLVGDVEPIQEPEEAVMPDLRQRLITQHMKLLELAGRTVNPSIYERVKKLSYMVAHNAGLDLPQKQHVLSLVTEHERVLFLIDHLEAFIPRIQKMERLRKLVRSNGHIRDFPPASDVT